MSTVCSVFVCMLTRCCVLFSLSALLDSLMGSDRNEPLKVRKSFKDPDVCHFYVLDFCPHDLFPNTKSDLGPCQNKHSDSYKTEFLADPDHEYYQWKYEEEFIGERDREIVTKYG